MNGKLIRGDVCIDYTGVPTSLRVEDINADILEVQMGFRSLDQFVMWQHQWDWLVSQSQPVTSEYAEMLGVQAGDSLTKHRHRSDKSLFGIPVRIAN